jgi:hypothetical protein
MTPSPTYGKAALLENRHNRRRRGKSDPIDAEAAARAGWPWSRTAAIAACHDTPKSPAAWATECSPGPDPAADLRAGPLGQHRPRGDLVALFGPGARQASRLGAAPHALGPHQHHRPIRQRQVAHHDAAAA